MTNDYVSLEIAQKLKENGYPQDQFPQMCYCFIHGFETNGEQNPKAWQLRYLFQATSTYDWVVALTILQALMWLREKEFSWSYWDRGTTQGWYWRRKSVGSSDRGPFEDPQDLILKCLEVM